MNGMISVMGGGPAGMSCALWLKNLGFVPVIIEKSEHLGGLQRESNYQNTWYLGLLGKTGYEVAQKFHEHIETQNIPILLGSQLRRIVREGDNFKLITQNHEITANGLVIATGQRMKGYEAIQSIEGSYELFSLKNVCFHPGATPSLVPVVDSKIVGVVGGGDNGLGTALRLADTAKHVHLFVRSNLQGFATNQKAICEKIETGKITLHKQVIIHRFEVREQKIYIIFSDEKNQNTELFFDHLCFRLGFTPNTEDIVRLFEQGGVGSLELTSKGHIATDQFLRTSIFQVYAAGDVVNCRDACVATAVAHGAIAARSLDEDLRGADITEALPSAWRDQS